MYRNSYANESEYEVRSVIDGSKIRLMVVELLQLEVGVHGCSNTNRNENYYLLSSRGVDSFDEGTVKNKSELVLVRTRMSSQNELK